MDTVNALVLRLAAEKLYVITYTTPNLTVHTVTVTLNGQHGGADMRVEGSMSCCADEAFDMTYRVSR